MTRREHLIWLLLFLGWIGYGTYFLVAGPVDVSEKVVAIVSVACGAIGLVWVSRER